MSRYVPAYPSVDQRARPGQPLDRTEITIIRRLAGGAHDHEIARALKISTRTYRRYLTAAMRKLGARTRAHTVVLAHQAHLIDLPRRPR